MNRAVAFCLAGYRYFIRPIRLFGGILSLDVALSRHGLFSDTEVLELVVVLFAGRS
ncbi:MAG: hypothetical protein LBM95_01415 [Lactobacillales bacterium]|nr:hypothetical protein [Lactobacillales bacterium]